MRVILLVAAAALSIAAAPKAAPLLTARDLDPALVLPPPPSPASPQAAAELAELHAAEARTPDAEADARHDGDTRNATIFAAVLGPKFDLATWSSPG